MKYLLKYLKPFSKLAFLALFVKLLGALMELSLPYILSYIINHVVSKHSLRAIFFWGGVMILAALCTVILNVTANRMAARVARNVSKDVRQKLFSKINALSGSQVDKFTVPSLESRLTSDTYNVHSVIERMLRMGIRAPIMFVGSIIFSLFLDPVLTLVMLSSIPFLLLIVTYITKRGVPLYSDVQQKVDGMTRVVREDAQGIRVIKALSKGDYERRRFDRVNSDLVAAERKVGLTMAISNPAFNIVLNFGMVAVILVGASRVRNGLTDPGTIIAFTQYFTQMSMAMLAISRIFTMLTKGSASARRVEEVLRTEEGLPVRSEADYPPKPGAPYLCFDSVNFSYNKTKNNLSDISFTLPKGGMLGIIGATGSGKSTLVHLLMRFYDPDSGAIYIGGKDIRTMSPEELHGLFGVVMQNDFLFADTVRENIDFGRGLSDSAIASAAEYAQAKDFIEAFPEGYDHLLTSKGTNVSGGQKQRLLISRALAGNPEILVLDDASSALDYKTDANLRNAIREHFAGTTTIVVTQRISSVMNADRILVLEEGEIIGDGTHAELLKTCEVYREISRSQMGGAILE